jgi:cytoskeletal protein CcmA (bactofilin family)
MFGKNGRKGVKGAVFGLNLLTNGTVLEGELTTSTDLRIDGKIIGHLKSTAMVIIGQEGCIEGDVHTENMRIAGTLKGNAEVSNELSLEATAYIEGDLIVGVLNVEDGAKINGRIHMKKSGSEVLKGGILSQGESFETRL